MCLADTAVWGQSDIVPPHAASTRGGSENANVSMHAASVASVGP